MGGVIDSASKPDASTIRVKSSDLLNQSTCRSRSPHVVADAQVRQRDLMTPLAQREQRIADDLATPHGRQQTARGSGFREHGIWELPERRAVRIPEFDDLVVGLTARFDLLNPHVVRHGPTSSRPATQPLRGALWHRAHERLELFPLRDRRMRTANAGLAMPVRSAISDRLGRLRIVSRHENNRMATVRHESTATVASPADAGRVRCRQAGGSPIVVSDNPEGSLSSGFRGSVVLGWPGCRCTLCRPQPGRLGIDDAVGMAHAT